MGRHGNQDDEVDEKTSPKSNYDSAIGRPAFRGDNPRSAPRRVGEHIAIKMSGRSPFSLKTHGSMRNAWKRGS